MNAFEMGIMDYIVAAVEEKRAAPVSMGKKLMDPRYLKALMGRYKANLTGSRVEGLKNRSDALNRRYWDTNAAKTRAERSLVDLQSGFEPVLHPKKQKLIKETQKQLNSLSNQETTLARNRDWLDHKRNFRAEQAMNDARTGASLAAGLGLGAGGLAALSRGGGSNDADQNKYAGVEENYVDRGFVDMLLAYKQAQAEYGRNPGLTPIENIQAGLAGALPGATGASGAIMAGSKAHQAFSKGLKGRAGLLAALAVGSAGLGAAGANWAMNKAKENILKNRKPVMLKGEK